MSKIPINQLSSIEQMTERLRTGKNVNTSSKHHSGISFNEILKEKTSIEEKKLKFSNHANQRMASRNIDLTDDQYERLEIATKKASKKGIKESLVMVDDLAFIVSVKNNTVITAVNDGDDKVFTNIDGAVIM